MTKCKLVDFRAVKASVTMEQVLQHYGLLDQMKRSGDSLSGCCPIHQGTNPTQFRVSISKNIFNCFSVCKSGGNVLDFVARMENVTAHSAALKLIEWFGLQADLPTEESEPQRPRPAAKAKPSPRVPSASPPLPELNTPNKPLGFQLKDLDAGHPYLTERGLTPETIVEFGLGYCAKGTMAGHVAIPIHNAEGQLVAYAGRWPGEPDKGTPKYKLPAGFRKSQEVFNLHRVVLQPDDQPLIIVEGFFDVMKLWQHGVKRVVALMGSSLSEAQRNLLFTSFTNQPRMIVLFDEDEAGRAGRFETAGKLASQTFVRVLCLPNEGQQPEHLSLSEVQALLH